MQTKKIKAWKVATSLITLAVVVAVSTIIVCAYYMSRVYIYTDDVGGKKLFRVGMELNTFFDQINSGTTTASTAIPAVTKYTPLGIPCTDISIITDTEYTKDGDYYTNTASGLTVKATETTSGDTTTTTYEYVYNSDATWGSASNPYIISKINYLQNLYVLQNVGYFKDYYWNDEADTDGDGVKEGAYIGTTEDYMPYFLVCTSLGTPVTIDGTNKIFEYIGNDDYPFVGYLGGAFVTTDSSENAVTTTVTKTVDGQTTTQTSSQSVIYNLTVQTDDDVVDIGLFGKIGYIGTPTSTTVGSTFEGSVSTVRDLLLYDVKVQVKDKSFWEAIVDIAAHLFTYEKNDDTKVPHETHHIGILAGHVEYATVEYISVYYSADDIAAIDVNQTTKSGENHDDVSANFYSVSGILGYVVEMNSVQQDGTVTIGGTNNDDVAVSGGDGTGGGDESGTGRGYVTAAEIFKEYTDGAVGSGKIVKVTATDPDTEKTVTKYGLLVQYYNETVASYTNEDNEDIDTHFRLADGTPVSCSDDQTYVTTYSESENFIGATEVVGQNWYDYVIHDMTKTAGDEGEYYYFKKAEDGTIVKKNDKPVQINATTIEVTGISLKLASKYNSTSNEWETLCTQYERDRIGSSLTGLSQSTGRYYFYDGVFTFALSEQSDTIEQTWADGTADEIVVGENNDDAWTQDTSGVPDSVVALLRPVKTTADLFTGELFIAYKETVTTTDNTTGKETTTVNYHIVTLDGNSGYTPGDGDDAVYTGKTTLSLATNELTTAISTAAANGTLNCSLSGSTTLADISGYFDNGEMTVLYVGTQGKSSSDKLAELKSKYQVTVTKNPLSEDIKDYEDDGVTEATDTLKANTKNIGSIYYTVTGTTTDENIKGATDIQTLTVYDENGIASYPFGNDYQIFKLEGTATINLANAQTAINTQNDKLYANQTYTTALDSTLRSKINLSSSGTQISQTEYKIYQNGYFYFYTFDVLGGICHYRLFYVDSSGNETKIVDDKRKGTFESWDTVLYSMFNSHTTITDVDGKSTIMAKKNNYANNAQIPLLYELFGTYYRTFNRDSGSTNYVSGSLVAEFENAASGSLKPYRLRIPVEVKYNYIVATETGNGTVYTWNGLSTRCSNVSKYSTVSAVASYDTKTLYGKDYDLYTCSQGNKAILVYRYAIDGIFLQTMTGNGAEISLVTAANDSGNTVLTYVKENLSGTFSPTGKTLTVDGVTYNVYSLGGYLGIRAANFDISGYFKATITQGEKTIYTENETTTELTETPKILPGVTYTLNNGSASKAYNLYVSGDKLAFELIHYNTGEEQFSYTFSHENSDDEDDPYTLRILRRNYPYLWVSANYKYGVICSTEAYVRDTSNFSSTVSCSETIYNDACTVLLNGNGTAYLQYTIAGETRYMAYSSRGFFTTSSTKGQSSYTYTVDNTTYTATADSQLYLFTLKGTYEASFGEKIVPVGGATSTTYAADQYVLWPDNVYNSNNTETSKYNPSNGYAEDTSYTIKSMASLYASGWKDKYGHSVAESNITLSSVFSLGQGITNVDMINLWGGNTGTIFQSDGYVKAPIGTTGEEAYIPTGCVAFRVNETVQENKIRVIVAVPVSEYYYGEGNSSDEVLNPSSSELDYSEDYFFCMWKIAEANEETNYSFSVDNCYAAFELPRSTPYNPGDHANQYYSPLASSSDYDVTDTTAVKKYINVNYTYTKTGETTATTVSGRAYLNGEQVLVAYEFDATEEGIYLLGSTKECRIVFFSADSTASAGKDGVTNYKVGTIDFVYDDASYTITSNTPSTTETPTRIITVRDVNKGNNKVTDYTQYYYASLVLLYTDNYASINGTEQQDGDVKNGFPNINDFAIYIRRVATHNQDTGGVATICWQACDGSNSYDANYIQLLRYAVASDPESQKTNGKR